MATAAKSEKRAMVNFMFLLLEETGFEVDRRQRSDMMMNCERKSETRKKMVVLG
jgi:hypothetical protein